MILFRSSFFNKRTYILLLSFFLLTNIFAQDQITNLPSVYINTVNNQSITDKINWIPAYITVVSTDTTEQLNMGTTIRGRGNSTWGMPKKPYRIKLFDKKHFLNMPAKNKDWVFLANYADKTLIRNALAFEISKLVGLEFTPAYRFVDFTLNNDFKGNYMVTDQVEVEKKRVNIDKLDSTDVSDSIITGGYLLEIDGFANDEKVWFTTPKGMKISVKSPDDDVITNKQLSYIEKYMGDFENTLFSVNFKDPVKGYRAKVDTTSLINWYIACELTGNSDSFWSTYVYKKRGDNKLYFGPLWDYDIAFNNDSRMGDATEKLMSQTAYSRTWIERLQQDDWFIKATYRRWKEIYANNLSGTLNTFINNTKDLIYTSQQKNFERWNNISTKVYLETFLFDTYDDGVDYLKQYMNERINFLNDALGNIVGTNPSAPFVLSNNYYKIRNKTSNNVLQIKNSSVEPDSTIELWESLSESDNQLWKLIPVDSVYYMIINKNSGLAIESNGKSNTLTQVQFDDDDAQEWEIVPTNTANLYAFINKKSGMAIDNTAGNHANGTRAIVWDNTIYTNTNQQWYLDKMNAISTGTSELFTNKISIYPNPATDKVSVRLNSTTTSNMSIRIYSLTGNVIYSSQVTNTLDGFVVKTIPLYDCSSGIYFINIKTPDGLNVTQKLIVKK